MQIIWKGPMTEKNQFVYGTLPKQAKKLLPEHGQWAMYLLAIPILLAAYAGLRVRITYAEGAVLSRWFFIVGAGLCLFAIPAHEFIHALCCPRRTKVYLYTVPLGVCMIPTCPLGKYRYLFMVTMPCLVLGVLPFLVWMCVPALGAKAGSVFVGFAVGSLSLSIGDLYNAIFAAIKMTSRSVLVTSGAHCYYFEAGSHA